MGVNQASPCRSDQSANGEHSRNVSVGTYRAGERNPPNDNVRVLKLSFKTRRMASSKYGLEILTKGSRQ